MTAYIFDSATPMIAYIFDSERQRMMPISSQKFNYQPQNQIHIPLKVSHACTIIHFQVILSLTQNSCALSFQCSANHNFPVSIILDSSVSLIKEGITPLEAWARKAYAKSSSGFKKDTFPHHIHTQKYGDRHGTKY